MTRSHSQIGSLLVAVLAASAIPAFAQTQAAPAPAPACKDCGRVESIRFVQEKGKGTGLGAVAGGVLGGVIGHQIGGGTGQTVATIAGAAGGAYVGNEVEKNKRSNAYWEITLRMDTGNTRIFHYTNQPTVNEGERVKLVDGGRRLALVAP
jgi:outer membrane lipoprotein SlyB